jgi:hypothetical protein
MKKGKGKGKDYSGNEVEIDVPDGASLQRELRCDWAEVALGMDCESQSE